MMIDVIDASLLKIRLKCESFSVGDDSGYDDFDVNILDVNYLIIQYLEKFPKNKFLDMNMRVTYKQEIEALILNKFNIKHSFIKKIWLKFYFGSENLIPFENCIHISIYTNYIRYDFSFDLTDCLL